MAPTVALHFRMKHKSRTEKRKLLAPNSCDFNKIPALVS